MKKKYWFWESNQDKRFLDLYVVLISSRVEAIEFSNFVDEVYSLERLFVENLKYLITFIALLGVVYFTYIKVVPKIKLEQSLNRKLSNRFFENNTWPRPFDYIIIWHMHLHSHQHSKQSF